MNDSDQNKPLFTDSVAYLLRLIQVCPRFILYEKTYQTLRNKYSSAYFNSSELYCGKYLFEFFCNSTVTPVQKFVMLYFIALEHEHITTHLSSSQTQTKFKLD